jgi:hypothetical protein
MKLQEKEEQRANRGEQVQPGECPGFFDPMVPGQGERYKESLGAIELGHKTSCFSPFEQIIA